MITSLHKFQFIWRTRPLVWPDLDNYDSCRAFQVKSKGIGKLLPCVDPFHAIMKQSAISNYPDDVVIKWYAIRDPAFLCGGKLSKCYVWTASKRGTSQRDDTKTPSVSHLYFNMKLKGQSLKRKLHPLYDWICTSREELALKIGLHEWHSWALNMRKLSHWACLSILMFFLKIYSVTLIMSFFQTNFLRLIHSGKMEQFGGHLAGTHHCILLNPRVHHGSPSIRI